MVLKKITRNLKRLIVFIIFLEMFPGTAASNPGDTTWVTVYNLRKLDHYGNYDTTAVFPTGKRYRKVRLHYILGRYACPAGTQYCGSCDYTTQIFARPQGKDTVEVARVITPYATDWLTTNKKHDFIIDVTDYASVLDGSTGMRFKYDGYSWGFTITLKIEFIEGIPPMDAASVKNIYNGYFPYGNASNSIENYLTAKTVTYSTPRAYVKNSVSGHGSDNTGCSEFCNKYYTLMIDNNQLAQRQLWRSDCGVNHVYPQTGTWVFDRSNWCPGAVVWPIYHDLYLQTVPNTPFSVDVNMQPYVNSNPSGGYNFVSQLISYSAPNHSRDVAIEDLVRPTFDENHFRDNPACSHPAVKIRNTGEDSVYSVVFEYGLTGLTLSSYTWTGQLGFLQETEVEFPASLPVMSQTTSLPFEVKITDVNAAGPDQYALNDVYRTMTRTVSIFPSSFVINTITNGATNPSTFKNQTTWTLFDAQGNVIAFRDQMNNNTQHKDTISLADGCYKFVVEDSGCDGIAWWYYQYYNPNPGSGIIEFKNVNNPGYVFAPSGDFGCGYTKFFHVGTAPPPPPVPNLPGYAEYALNGFIELFPNPSGETANLRIASHGVLPELYTLCDLSGKEISRRSLARKEFVHEEISTASLSAGVYFVTVHFVSGESVRRKLVIAR